jgi:SulP family sulfate permease
MNTGAKLNVNQELQTVGYSNVVSGLCGGYTGSYIFSQTSFAFASETNSKIVGATVCAVELFIFFWSKNPLSYIPKFFFASMMIFVSIGLLREWIFVVRSKITLHEYVLLWCTFILINILGLTGGFLCGITLAIIFHTVTLSKAGTFIKRRQKRSNVSRSYREQKLLQSLDNHIITLELSGPLFFGTSLIILESVSEYVRSVGSSSARRMSVDFNGNASEHSSLLSHGAESTNQNVVNKPVFIILDFKHVIQMDGTAIRNCFLALTQMCHQDRITLVFSSLDHDGRALFMANNIAPAKRMFPSLDNALESCESKLLEFCIRTDSFTSLIPSNADGQHPQCDLPQLFREFTGANLRDLEGVQKYFTLECFEKNEVIFSIGQASDCFYIVLEGEAILYLVDPHEYVKCSEHSVEGKVLHRVRRGCFFGKS